MRLAFVDRTKELSRLQRALRSREPVFLVIYGRRRCGKSRLIQELRSSPQNDVYYLADLREPSLQRRSLAQEVGRAIPHFDRVEYPDWLALLQSFEERARPGMCLHLDEFPNLVRVSPELPSVLQKMLDAPDGPGASYVLCGSSQRMMHGLVLDSSAPLYGRAREILKIRPLAPGWICEALKVRGVAAVETYAVWGGVPRYWELATDHQSLGEAIRSLVLDRDGPLHEEPTRLLADDMRTTVQPHSILSLVGAGSHRLSEIAGRLGKPAASLTRPLALLADLGYVRRETPFGESPKRSKKTCYRLCDPFLSFWYRFVVPGESLLEIDLIDEVYDQIETQFPQHVAQVWEDLARRSVPALKPGGVQWGPAARWWGPDAHGSPMEIDLVAESVDRRSLLFGEVKWSDRAEVSRTRYELESKARRFPLLEGREAHFSLWVKNRHTRDAGSAVFTPVDVMAALL